MKIKTSELQGAALDWAVAKCEGHAASHLKGFIYEVDWRNKRTPHYSTNWTQGGPIIEREHVNLDHDGGLWWAHDSRGISHCGETPLVAAMRLYVHWRLGLMVDIPGGIA